MFAKPSTLFALFALAARLAVATPPACMIAAVNTQPNPAALQAVCSGSNATAVEEYICKNCSSNAAAALSAFASVQFDILLLDLLILRFCVENQQRIRHRLSYSASTGSPSGNGTLSIPPGSAPSATSGNGSGSGSGTAGSGSGSGASPTPSSSSVPANAAAARLGMDIVGLAAVGAFGLMLAF
ncbi:hypothetical protein B0A55_03896 [Friedmanniomyces simplex]|uniref:Extracellular membrane protein CFEM domain-containing protein n=1 Tax=Friedmanniomyces simplex TaxID=329884 RepID=A0A4V6WL81_9PEZI|nr:hypothetical protein B0A55_03896 [Friedmanniomyces simplex]